MPYVNIQQKIRMLKAAKFQSEMQKTQKIENQ